MEEQESLPMQLRIGGVYLARNGAHFGPMETFVAHGNTYFREINRYGYWWDGNGLFGGKSGEHPFDLILENTILPPATPADKKPKHLEKLARKLLPLIIQREGLGPLNAADRAFEYAKAFFARAEQE